MHVADKMFGKSSVPWDPRPCDPHLDWTTKAALPLFRRLTRLVLRSHAEGADTVVWMAQSNQATLSTGKLFLDREPRTTHLRKNTRESAGARAELLPWLRATYAALPLEGSS